MYTKTFRIMAILWAIILASSAKDFTTPAGSVLEWGEHVMPIVSPRTHFISISAGEAHNLAITSNGTVVEWGLNYLGQCMVPPGLSNVVAVGGGYNHSLALTANGTIVAWGWPTNLPANARNIRAISVRENHDLALKSDGTVISWGPPDATGVPPGLTNIVAIAAGSAHSLALKSNGEVIAWGNNYYGQTNVPSDLSNVIAIAAGAYHNLALKSDGTVVDWGTNDPYAGPGIDLSIVPAGLSNVIAISAGDLHSLALKSDGTVVAWGANGFGQATVPDGLNGVIAVAGGGNHSLALKSDGSVVAWGYNADGQSTVPTDLSDVRAIAGNYGSLALNANGTVIALGDNAVPPGLSNVIAISAGFLTGLALKSDGTLTAWGKVPVYVPTGLNNVTAIASGSAHYLALRSDRTVAAWGGNSNGETNIPPGLSNVIAIAAGAWHCLALKSDGTVVGWGNNMFGQSIGITGQDITAIAAGWGHSLALKSDGTVIAWGRNTDFNGNYAGQSHVPAGLSNVIAIAAGYVHSLALKSDGTVVAWGSNDSLTEYYAGQSTVPEGLSNVVAIAGGWAESLALVASPPCVLTCPTNITVRNDPGQCGAAVHFDLPSATNCEGSVIICNPPSGSFFPTGTNTVQCVATNAAGQVTDSCSFEIIIQDCEPPVIQSMAASPNVLWPPNHKMQAVTISVSAMDNCNVASCKIISVTSSEPDDTNSNANPDWQITGDLTLNLRADRSGNGPGRVYTITIECADDSGNISTAVARVTVPHSTARTEVSRPTIEHAGRDFASRRQAVSNPTYRLPKREDLRANE